MSKAGEIAAKGVGLITGAATAAGAALLALESSTEEYRIAQGKLNTAFEAAGYSTETAKQAYTDFYKILGDTDTATEASQLLAKLAQSEEDVAKWTNIAAGVSGTFGDSLPIEGLIEASNETAKVGQVTGVLADALNWAGISEDEFNEKLAACTDESDRNRLIMETLSGTYDDAADAFYRNNEALVESRNNQAMLDESLGNIGASVTTVKNAFLEQFSPAITEASEKVAGFISNIDAEEVVHKVQQIIDKFIELSPIITGAASAFIAYKAAMTISSIIDAVTKATQGMTIAQAALNAVMNANPFVLIATLIAAVGTALVTLYMTNEDFRNKVNAIWGNIKSFIENAVSAIVTFFTTTIPNAAKKALEWFKSIPESMKEIGKNIVQGVWNGIQSMVSWFTNKVKGFFNGIVGSVKNLLGIHSPSTVFADMGENMALGLGKGWDSEYSNIKRDIEKGLDIGDASASVNITRRVNTSSRFSELENVVHAIISGMNIQVVLDDGTLVGKIAPKMNNALGDIDTLGRRGGCTA